MKTSWDLTHLFLSKMEWDIAKENLIHKTKQFEQEMPTFCENFEAFESGLKQKIKIDYEIERVYCYPKRFTDLNALDEEHQAMTREAWSIYETILKLTKDFTFLLQNNRVFVDKFCVNNPYYDRYIKILLRNGNYTLSREIENIKEVYRTLTQIDLSLGTLELENGEEVTLNAKQMQNILSGSCESDRVHALEQQNAVYMRIENTLAVLLQQKYQVEVDKAKERNFSLMEQNLNSMELPPHIIEHLIQVANKNLYLQQEYIAFKKMVLGVEEYRVSDMMLPLGFISKMEIEFEEAVHILKESFRVLGDSYEKKIDEALQNGWIDVYSKPHKRKMSYSCISYAGVPYASLNYDKSISSVRTLGHELGHSIHTAFSKENNAFEYFEYSLFLSEVVSKVNEILFNEYLLSHYENTEEKLFLLTNIVSSLGNTLFNQVMNTEFEHTIIQSIEQNKKLNVKKINQIYRELFSKYHGIDVVIDVDNSSAWMRIPHFLFNDAYYLYQYSIGVALAIEIVRKIHEEQNFVDKYIEFLSIGNQKNILDSLQVLGIDLEDSQYLENAYRYLEKNIRELKRLKK